MQEISRFCKPNPANLVWLQVNKDNLTIVLDDVLEDTSVEEVRESLPDHQPRYHGYIVLKAKVPKSLDKDKVPEGRKYF